MNNGRKVAEGGVLLAIYCALLFVTVQIPFLGMITFFFLPVPFILVTMKEKLSWAFGFLAVASVLTIIFGTIYSIPMTLFTGVVGIVVGYHLKHDKSTIQMLITSVLTVIVCLLIFYSATILVTNVNIIEELMNMFKQSMDTSMELMNSSGQSVPEGVQKKMRDSLEMIYTLMPSALVISSAIMAYLFVLAARPFVKRFSDKTVKWPIFRDLCLPKSLLWYYIIVLIASFFVKVDSSNYVNVAIMNLLFILQLFILLQGFSLIFYISHEKGWIKVVPILLVLGSLFIPIMLTIVRILGIIDLSFPFRKAITKPKQR